MLKTLTSFFVAKKACLRVVARKVRRDKVYYLQGAIQAWNLPGLLNLHGGTGGHMVEIILEGREEILRKRLAELEQHPCLNSAPIEYSWLPYEKKYPHFTIVF